MSDSCHPVDCSPPGSSVHGDFPGKDTGVSCHFLLQGIFQTQGSNPGLLHWQADSWPLSHLGSQKLERQCLICSLWSLSTPCSLHGPRVGGGGTGAPPIITQLSNLWAWVPSAVKWGVGLSYHRLMVLAKILWPRHPDLILLPESVEKFNYTTWPKILKKEEKTAGHGCPFWLTPPLEPVLLTPFL